MEHSIKLDLATALLLSAACSRLPLPFTAAQLQEASARMPPGKVLVHFLAQRDADPSVCDVRNPSGHLARVDERAMQDLVDALVDGKVAPAVFERCASLLLVDAAQPVAMSLLSAAAEAIVDRLRDADFDDAVANRVEALHCFLAQRPTADGLSSPVSAVLERLVMRIEAAREEGRLGPRARQLGAVIVATVEMDLGRLGGTPVTAERLETLEDEPVLSRLATRLPTESLRTAARRRVVRLHIKSSAFPDVRERARQVEESVMELGRNPVAPGQGALRRSWIETSALAHGVLVRQDLVRQRTSLLSYRGDEPGESVLPTLDLKGLLMFEVAGISWPITLCAPAAKLAVDPCLDARTVEAGNPIARMDEDGMVHFVDDVPLSTAVGLLESSGGFALRPSYEKQVLTSVELPLWFERPRDLVLQAGTGARGPDLSIRADAFPGRLVFSTRQAKTPETGALLAVVQLRDAESFHVVSRGGPGTNGYTGSRGADGAQGNMGSPAICPSSPGGMGGAGGPGGTGGNGGPGGRGGDGGEVTVELRCTRASCEGLVPLLQKMVLSMGGQGGAGGAGGAGGQGGQGGAGGSGTGCYANGQYTSVGGGSPGSRGSNGSNGSSGAAGAPGAAGAVQIRVAR